MNEEMFQFGIILMFHSVLLFAIAWGRPLLRAVSYQILNITIKPKRSVEVIKYLPLGGRR